MSRLFKQLLIVVCAGAILLALSAVATRLSAGSESHLMTRSRATADSWYTSADAPDAIVQATGVLLELHSALARVGLPPSPHKARAVAEFPWNDRAPPLL